MAWSKLVDSTLVHDAIGWRRHLHAHPELSFQEHDTTTFIADLLSAWDVEVERPLETGVVARIRGRTPGPTVAVRADIDALPIHEENTFDFASRSPGRMHACGHDGHTAILLGVARILASRPDQFRGEVRLLFQPTEEVPQGGAQAFLAAGALSDAECVLGLHLLSTLDTGQISVREGAIMASADEFTIRLRGTGGHGAFPHLSVDPIVAASHLVGVLQTIVSRRIDPLVPAVVTVGTFHAGSAFNIIPGEAVLTGTTRALSDGARDQLQREIEQVTSDCARMFRATVELNYRRGCPVLVNDRAMAELAAEAAGAVVGEDRVMAAPPILGGDDFAFYGQQIPAVYLWVGTRNAAADSVFPHHHPRFTIDEDSLRVGIGVFLETLERAGCRA